MSKKEARRIAITTGVLRLAEGWFIKKNHEGLWELAHAAHGISTTHKDFTGVWNASKEVDHGVVK
jgi:hypothetical protein